MQNPTYPSSTMPFSPYPNYSNYGTDYYQNRLNQIQGYMQQPFQSQVPPFQPQQQQSQSNIICRAVTSIDEAKAAMVDALNIYIFTDFANGSVYVKQISNDGTAMLRTYKLDVTPLAPVVTTEDRLSQLEEQIQKLSEGMTNVQQSNPGTSNGAAKGSKSATTTTATNAS